MRTLTLTSGAKISVVGQGTWAMGERANQRQREIDALRLGIELGMTLIDTAEMYADGKAEEIVGEATAGQRERVFVVTKVLPSHAAGHDPSGGAQPAPPADRVDRSLPAALGELLSDRGHLDSVCGAARPGQGARVWGQQLRS